MSQENQNQEQQTEVVSTQSNVVASGDVIKRINVVGIMFNEKLGLFEVIRDVNFFVDGAALLPRPAQERITCELADFGNMKAILDECKTIMPVAKEPAIQPVATTAS